MTINQYEQYIQEQGWDDRFRYMLLDRMRSDCDYFLATGKSTATIFGPKT